MTNLIRIAAAVALVIGAGLVHGSWTNRWRLSSQLSETALRLESLPMKIGDWAGIPTPIPESEKKIAGAIGCLTRQYTNSKTGDAVSVMLICGLPGNIVNHTPDVCYTGNGYSLESPGAFQTSFGDPPKSAEFLTSIATRRGSAPSTLRIFWSWNDSNGWRTPEAPYRTFAAAPALYKLYVVRETAGETISAEDDPSQNLLASLLLAIDHVVFSGDQVDASE